MIRVDTETACAFCPGCSIAKLVPYYDTSRLTRVTRFPALSSIAELVLTMVRVDPSERHSRLAIFSCNRHLELCSFLNIHDPEPDRAQNIQQGLSSLETFRDIQNLQQVENIKEGE